MNEYSREHSEKLKAQATSDISADFPTQKLSQQNGSSPNLVFVACGSFNPITFMHLRLFEQAKDYANIHGFNVVGGYISPVSDAYKKKGLISAIHRAKMCELAVESSDWIMIDKWESSQKEYQTTLPVLEHFSACLNSQRNLKKGEENNNDKSKQKEENVQVKLVCGGDLLESMNTPGVWAPEDIRDIVSKYGIFVLERTGTDIAAVVYNNDILFKYQTNIHIMKQTITNDISATKVRQSIQRNLSIKYLTPDGVVKYIQDNKLYQL